MITLAKSTKSAPVKSQAMLLLSYALGLGTAVLAVAQMVSFEDFVEALRAYQVGGENATLAIAVGVLGLEVFATPFLLRLSLSPAARFVSALFALLLPYVWTVLTIHVFVANATVDNAGYFGGFFGLPVGAAVLVLDLLWAIAATVSFRALGGVEALRPKL